LEPKLNGTVSDRMDIIGKYVRGNAVMDLGCVDSRRARKGTVERIEYKANLLHKRIAAINPEVLGVDIDPQGVEALNSQGFKTMVADVETMNLGRQFDAIVAGELIEHLENPGLFLRNMRKHLKEDGVIIISTPNPFYAGWVWKIWRYGVPSVHEEHMGWQDPTTLRQLLRRTGYEPVEGFWVQPRRSLLKQRFLRCYFSHSFLIVARKRPGETKP
jgi:2-polyprenyl-3-methyl-5-hydroxy-6-metoxy-1,4-benzoquinol methylase